MFDQPYPYEFIKHEPAQRVAGYSFTTSLYRFKALDANGGYQVFLIIVEKYDCETYVVKFCRKADRHQDNAFTHMTNTPDASRKIATVVQVMFDIFQENRLASFGWIGAPDQVDGNPAHTRRFTVWSRVMNWLFSEEVFRHYTYAEQSAYLMHNIAASEQYPLARIEAIFKNVYPEL